MNLMLMNCIIIEKNNVMETDHELSPHNNFSCVAESSYLNFIAIILFYYLLFDTNFIFGLIIITTNNYPHNALLHFKMLHVFFLL